jgi:hypothetical protein
MRLKNYTSLLKLDTAISNWEVAESGNCMDLRQHLQEGLHEQAESIKCIINADIKDAIIERKRMEEVFAEAYVALYFVKMKYSIHMDSDSFQNSIDEHCEFLSKQYEVESDFSTMEF